MPLPDATRFYINGEWAAPNKARLSPIINPATEASVGDVALGNESDVDVAVAAAKTAFSEFSKTSRQQRLQWLRAINDGLVARQEDMAQAISAEMGAPITVAREAQAPSGPQHFEATIKVLESYEFNQNLGGTQLRKEPVGVCALITPWNWPINQIAIKVAPAIAAGCTMVLKPSELSPLSASLLAEIIHESGLPDGVFNLVHGDGQGVGAPLIAHKDIDMVSFTGSTRAGVAISQSAAPDIKRVSLELGGKSAAIVMPDADIAKAIPSIIKGVMYNSGQSCNARTRLLIPSSLYDAVVNIAMQTCKGLTVGTPESEDVYLGPLANKPQYVRVLKMIKIGIDEGAKLLCGGVEKPSGLVSGYYVKPTLFGNVTNDMRIAREEVFGPVVTLMKYESAQEAIEIANDSEYGLSGAVWSANHGSACDVASQLRTGMVHINGAGLDSAAPFGGYKKSGNGREWGEYGLEGFLEVKSVYGANI